MAVRTPSYRYHKARNCAVVTVNGHDHYLGDFDSPESWEKYHRLVAECLAAATRPHQPRCPASAVSPSAELIARVLEVRQAVLRQGRQAHQRAGHHPPSDAVPPATLRLVICPGIHAQEAQGRAGSDDRAQDCSPVQVYMTPRPARRSSRSVFCSTGSPGVTSTSRSTRIKRMFAWAVEEELVPVEVHAALLRVKGLKKGKAHAREKPRIRPVPQRHRRGRPAVGPRDNPRHDPAATALRLPASRGGRDPRRRHRHDTPSLGIPAQAVQVGAPQRRVRPRSRPSDLPGTPRPGDPSALPGGRISGVHLLAGPLRGGTERVPEATPHEPNDSKPGGTQTPRTHTGSASRPLRRGKLPPGDSHARASRRVYRSGTRTSSGIAA